MQQNTRSDREVLVLGESRLWRRCLNSSGVSTSHLWEMVCTSFSSTWVERYKDCCKSGKKLSYFSSCWYTVDFLNGHLELVPAFLCSLYWHYRFFFNCFGCLFNREDHFQYHTDMYLRRTLRAGPREVRLRELIVCVTDWYKLWALNNRFKRWY